MIIGFTGKAQSGKSTACQMVQGDLPDVIRVNFKDGLVNEMKKNFPNTLKGLGALMGEVNATQDFSLERLFDTKPTTMRAFMQEYGTEVRRGDDQDYWIKIWKETVLANQEFHIVCDDVRFLNEAKALKEMGGVLVRIKRDDITDTGNHQSEMEMDQIEVDYTFNAVKDGHEQLHAQIRELYTPELIPSN
jgi:hypothetical protein